MIFLWKWGMMLLRTFMKKFIIFILGIGAILYVFYRMSLGAVDASSEESVRVTIEEGSSVKQIAVLLEEKGLIKSSRSFGIYAKLHGKEASLQAGLFVLSPNQSTPEIIEALQSADSEEMSITIPEGFTVKDIEELLVKKGLIENGAITECLKTCDFSTFTFLPDASGLADRGGRIEGYLYPDTYFVSVQDFVPKFFLERLMSTYKAKVIDVYADEIEASGRTLHELTTMASLIEEETRTDDERKIVSGILWKRFDEGMGLGVDATVRYIVNKPSSAITVADLNNGSPYNTRKFRGLPPGPIANSSLKSFEAALRPEESPYWYYLHGNDGQIRYAKTNEEHNLNKARFLD